MAASARWNTLGLVAGMVAIYKMPADVEAFEKHYFGTHIPLAKKMPGLLKYEVSQGTEMGRPSRLKLTARRQDGGIRSTVGGGCVPMFRGEALV